MKIVKDSEIDNSKWLEFLNSNGYASPFQSPEFYSLFNAVSLYRARVFAVENEERILALCVVTFQKQEGFVGFFSRRSIVYGGPLVTNTEKGREALSLLLLDINHSTKGDSIYIETYNFFDYSEFKDIFESSGWMYVRHLNVQMQISGKSINDILASMKYNRRREITLSIKEGTTFREVNSLDEVKNLYNLLVDLYNDRVKLPLPPYLLFKQLYLSRIGKVFIVLFDGNIVGGSFCIFLPGKAIYTYYYCGLREFQKNVFPSHMAVYAAIEYAVSNGLAVVDLMGAGKPDIDYGVREFKIRFGGELVEHGRFLKVVNPFMYMVGKSGLQLIKILKK